MKKLIIILTGVMTITGLISLDFAMAKKENTGVETGRNRPKASLSATPEEMKNMAELLEEMAYGIKSGNTTSEIEAKSAKILIHLSHILDALANPDDKVTYLINKHQSKEVENNGIPGTKWRIIDFNHELIFKLECEVIHLVS